MHGPHHAGRYPHGPTRRHARAQRLVLAGLALALGATSCREPAAPRPASPEKGSAVVNADQIRAQMARFAPVSLSVDLSGLPASERQTVGHLIDAARVLDGIYLDQVWSGNTGLLLRLADDASPEGRLALAAFLLNKGPWSQLDDDASFLGPEFDVPMRPAQANFYPADATREEVDAWLGTLEGAAHAQAAGFHSIIRRDATGALASVPYSVAYRNDLLAASAHLRAAAAATGNASLRRFLETRADAFLSNDYYDSDVAWMQIDADVEPTIGPYETYMDGWFGYKTAFEAFIAIRDRDATDRLARFGATLQAIEDALPILPAYRNPKIGALAPIRVVNLIFASGDGNHGVQTAAFNLPNDDRILRETGAKRVMLRNVQQAKFDQVLLPIARVALSAADAGRVSFDAFFTHILMHELMHGLGPHQVAGSGLAVRLALKDTSAAIEEAKADISGLWALRRLADQGALDADVADALFTTFLASAFRSIRFGLHEAHGRGIALQLNFLIDQGAVVVADDGTFRVEDAPFRSAIHTLTGELMTLQAEGNYEGAQALLARYVSVRPEVQRVLDRLADVPVDIAPTFDWHID